MLIFLADELDTSVSVLLGENSSDDIKTIVITYKKDKLVFAIFAPTHGNLPDKNLLN